jgi:hypothetical protein
VSNAAIPSYLEIIDLIAGGTTPQAVADYCPSPEAQRHIAELIAQEKDCSISVEERSELDHFMDMEHILRADRLRLRASTHRGRGYMPPAQHLKIGPLLPKRFNLKLRMVCLGIRFLHGDGNGQAIREAILVSATIWSIESQADLERSFSTARRV